MIALDKSRPKPSWSRSAVLQRVSRRYARFVFTAIFLSFTFVISLSLLQARSTRTWSVETTVHHQDATKSRPPQYPLLPFPESPLQSDSNLPDAPSHRPWLTAVICAAQDVDRRMLIRSTWMRLFRDTPFDPRFVVSNPGPDLIEAVRQENRTFGDMIVLDHIPEDDLTANTIKTLEFYKWLLNSGLKYEFVTKLDTDLWLNAPAFWQRYLVPRLSNHTTHPTATVAKTIIGQLYFSDTGYNTFAHGSMYTISWDMVRMLVSLQGRFNVITGEDAAVGILMHKARERASFVNLRGTEKFDYDDSDSRGDGSAWARQNSHTEATSHALRGEGAIAIHRLKDDKLWMKVADCFDEKGIKPTPTPVVPERQRLLIRIKDLLYSFGLSQEFTPLFEKIPKDLLRYERGNWVCDGIWNLGKSSKGFQ